LSVFFELKVGTTYKLYLFDRFLWLDKRNVEIETGVYEPLAENHFWSISKTISKKN